jgi:hypothetical protein
VLPETLPLSLGAASATRLLHLLQHHFGFLPSSLPLFHHLLLIHFFPPPRIRKYRASVLNLHSLQFILPRYYPYLSLSAILNVTMDDDSSVAHRAMAVRYYFTRHLSPALEVC